MQKLLLVVLALSFWTCQEPVGTEIRSLEDRAAQVTIIRDDYGIPHIYAKTDADAVFGMLYAQCEDDFRRVERNYIWATGRLAELEGEEALYSDLRARLYMTEAEAKAAYEAAPSWLQELCDAFADGVNYYLETHPEVEPRVLTHYQPWFPMYFSEGSIGGDIERISTQRIRAFYEEQQGLAYSEFGDGLLHPDPYEEPRGSNGIAIAPERSASGHALLLINPHTSFYFRPEIHVVSEEGLNAYGAVTWGQFFVYQGFNEKTGWMHTSTRLDFMDEFMEEVRETEDGYEYAYGEEWRAVEEIPVTLNYSTSDGLKEKTFTMYRTHHGPVTHQLDDKWVATKINWDPVNALIQSFTRTKLDNYEAFEEMMAIRTNSSNNTVFADASGNIAYFHGNFIPKRDTSFDFSKPVDGSNPATDWQGLHTVDESIVIHNPESGWIQNCNSTPFTAAGPFSPKKENYPYYMAPDAENFRGIHAVDLLSEASEVSLDDLIALGYDSYLPAFAYLVPLLEQAYETVGMPQGETAQAFELLREWDYRTGEASVAMSLGHFYGMAFARLIGSPYALIPFNQQDGTALDLQPEALVGAFEQALAQLEADFGTWNIPWGEINRFQRLSGDIDLAYDDSLESLPIGLASGRWGALASFGASARENTKKLYGSSGNSFVAAVEFGEKVRAKSLLAGGQNADPTSPHFDDQAEMYASGTFKEVAYYREDVESRAEETYQPGKR
ncbi:Acyl-homoserine lactone (AHL) acylase PvdQ [Cyclobacterium xiamenense]|uniref:Acyl-homoserine lactone (AHL) acylase PvdQ n=1 Tax=Cyclobacterium xiamenense TaxID=1297121 RepID=A0A1H7ARC3_9BACT|nr:penicillin acylase family protein [Cyclobacterium xiamenense]SEJ64632.1 Acyl-homoserine lactone (AHL) acylase PvdQ [Cyclobacterium xiamenense]